MPATATAGAVLSRSGSVPCWHTGLAAAVWGRRCLRFLLTQRRCLRAQRRAVGLLRDFARGSAPHSPGGTQCTHLHNRRDPQIEQAGSQTERGDAQNWRTYSQMEQTDSQMERANSQIEQSDAQTERADLHTGQVGSHACVHGAAAAVACRAGTLAWQPPCGGGVAYAFF